MSNSDYGKKFESTFKKDWMCCFPNTWFLRLHDQVTGYKTTSQNPCDFLGMHHGYMWMLECKETKEGTLNFAKIPQLDRKGSGDSSLQDFIGVKDTQTYIIIWFRSHDKVIACPAAEALRMKKDGLKSISLKMLNDKSYYIIELPSTKKRVFLETDYTRLIADDVLNECRARNCFTEGND